MNILLTGAFGFVGFNFLNAINSGLKHHLIAVDINVPDDHYYNNFCFWANLNKIDWNNIDTIIHLAGIAHDTKNTNDEKNYYEINVGLTQEIFKYYLLSNASKFIFFSSVKAVADKVLGEKLTEEVIPKPQTPYGKAKLEAEKYILSQTLPEYKKVYILRPCMIHGPGNKGNLNLLYRITKNGIPWPLGNYNNKRSFTSIDNLITIVSQILENDIDSGIYNIADDEPLSTNRMIELIAESKGKRSRIWKVNKHIIRFIAKTGDRIHLPLNSERLQKLTESYVVCNEKIKKALGIKKMPVSAEEGMKKTIRSFICKKN